MFIVINDKSQGSTAKHLRSDGLHMDGLRDCITYLSSNVLVKEFLKLVNIWGSFGKSLVSCFLTHGLYSSFTVRTAYIQRSAWQTIPMSSFQSRNSTAMCSAKTGERIEIPFGGYTLEV